MFEGLESSLRLSEGLRVKFESFETGSVLLGNREIWIRSLSEIRITK